MAEVLFYVSYVIVNANNDSLFAVRSTIILVSSRNSGYFWCWKWCSILKSRKISNIIWTLLPKVEILVLFSHASQFKSRPPLLIKRKKINFFFFAHSGKTVKQNRRRYLKSAPEQRREVSLKRGDLTSLHVLRYEELKKVK